jgi:hypothetical protein
MCSESLATPTKYRNFQEKLDLSDATKTESAEMRKPSKIFYHPRQISNEKIAEGVSNKFEK